MQPKYTYMFIIHAWASWTKDKKIPCYKNFILFYGEKQMGCWVM